MFFISHVANNKYAVVDTDDGVIDLLSRHEYIFYQAKGFNIMSWQDVKGYITEKMYRHSVSKLYKYLLKCNSDAELAQYLHFNVVYPIVDILNSHGLQLSLRNLCRFFNYSQTGGYFVIVLGVSDNKTLVCTIYEELAIDTKILDRDIKFGLYPSCSGWQINRLLAKVNLSFNALSDSCTYLLMYSDDYSTIHIVNHYDLDVMYCVSNPSRKMLC